jgi:hypothetical protein
LNIIFNLVNVKHQIKHPDDVLRKIRSNHVKIAGRLTAKIGDFLTGEKKCCKQRIHFKAMVYENAYHMLWGDVFGKFIPFSRVICRNTSPHTICIFICHCLDMYYFFIQSAARTLIILTIFAHFCLFVIISCHESCDNVHLPL